MGVNDTSMVLPPLLICVATTGPVGAEGRPEFAVGVTSTAVLAADVAEPAVPAFVAVTVTAYWAPLVSGPIVQEVPVSGLGRQVSDGMAAAPVAVAVAV